MPAAVTAVIFMNLENDKVGSLELEASVNL